MDCAVIIQRAAEIARSARDIRKSIDNGDSTSAQRAVEVIKIHLGVIDAELNDRS